MINDTVDLLDASIINYGINFEVLGDMDINKYDLLQKCVEEIRTKLIKVKKGIGEPVYLTDIYRVLNDVPGVLDTTSVEIVNKYGGVYSDYRYDVYSNLAGNGRYVSIPEDAVAEVLLPNQDILGVVK